MSINSHIITVIDASGSMDSGVLDYALTYAPGIVYLVSDKGVGLYNSGQDAKDAGENTMAGGHRSGFFNVVQAVQRRHPGSFFCIVADGTSDGLDYKSIQLPELIDAKS